MDTPASRVDSNLLNPANAGTNTLTIISSSRTTAISTLATNPFDRLNETLADYATSSINYDGLSMASTASASAATSPASTMLNVLTFVETTSSLAGDVTESFVNCSARPTDAMTSQPNNYWALLALVLVVGTAAGNILVCLAITHERRLQNITNYFLMSLAITDLMVAILVMPVGILTLFKGESILRSRCLSVQFFFCGASAAMVANSGNPA